MPQYLKYACLILILLLAFAGRVINIDQESLWVDEGFSYWAIRHDDMFGLLLRDVHPPIYFVTLRGWSQLAGITELALRYFSVLPSLLSVVLVYYIARELQDTARMRREFAIIPLLAALMMALADMENYIAQETRSYTWHVLWACASMWLFLRWIRLTGSGALIRHNRIEHDQALPSPDPFPPGGGRGVSTENSPSRIKREEFGVRDKSNLKPLKYIRNLSFPLWIITSLLLLYTHYIGICTIIVQGLVVLLFLRGRQRLQAVAALIVIGVMFVPWLAVVVSNQTDNIGTGFNVPSTLESLWQYRVNWFTQQWALMIGLAVVGLFYVTAHRRGVLLRRPDNLFPAFLMLAWFVIPIILTYLLNFRVPILIDYRLTQITPAAALMVAFGIASFRPPTRTFLLAVIVIYGVTIDDTAVKRPPWREVGRSAAQYALPGDLAMTHVTPSGDWQVMYYYERFMPDGVERRSLRQWQLEQGETYASGLPTLLEEFPHVWFMHWSKDLSGFEALAQTGHAQTAVMTEDWLGNDLNVYRFDVVPAGDQAITAYENGMILRDAAVVDAPLRIDLWWSADVPFELDFTVSAILLDSNGVLVAQDDAYPFAGQRPTSGWLPGDVIYDPHMLKLADGIEALPPGTYTAAVKIYLWSPDGITIIPTANGDEFTAVGLIEIP